MSSLPWGAIATVLVGLLAAFGTWLGVRASRADKKIDNAQASYDQLQEDRKQDREELAQLRTELAAVKKAHGEEIAGLKKELTDARQRITDLERTHRLKDEYVWLLRRHINDGKRAPAPEWPEGLDYR